MTTIIVYISADKYLVECIPYRSPVSSYSCCQQMVSYVDVPKSSSTILMIIIQLLLSSVRLSQRWKKTPQPRRCSSVTGSNRLQLLQKTKSQTYDLKDATDLSFNLKAEDNNGIKFHLLEKKSKVFSSFLRTKEQCDTYCDFAVIPAD